MKRTAPAWLWSRLLPLEMSIAIVIVCITTAWCIGQFARIFDEAHMTEILMRLSVHRIDVTEYVALQGQVESAHSRSNTDASDQPPNKTGRYHYRTEGSALVSTGTWSSGRPFELTFLPVINTESSGWILQWSCSNRQTSAHDSLSLKYDAAPASPPPRQAPTSFPCQASTGH